MVSAADSRAGRSASSSGRDGPDVVHPRTVACGPVRAVVCNELGPPSLLRVEERPDPVPGPGHVVVDVEAAGVNYVDALFVGGQYQIKPPVPFVPGTEAAGRVSQVGESVSGLEAGQRVLVSAGLGGFATKVAAPAAAVTALPDVLDAPRAATFTQSYSTCLFALRERAAAQPGESVLVLGAGGGVGLAAIGVARALGCRVLGVASTEEKRAAALAAGAEAVLDPAAERSRTRRGPGPAAPVSTSSSTPWAARWPSRRCAPWATGAATSSSGSRAGPIPSVPLNQVLLRNRTVIGIDWGIWAMQHADEQRALLADLLAMVEAGRSTRCADGLPPRASGEALEDLLGRRVVGKVALVP